MVVWKDNGSLRCEGYPVPAVAVLGCLLLDSVTFVLFTIFLDMQTKATLTNAERK